MTTGETAFPAFLEELQRIADAQEASTQSLKKLAEEAPAIRANLQALNGNVEVLIEVLNRWSKR